MSRLSTPRSALCSAVFVLFASQLLSPSFAQDALKPTYISFQVLNSYTTPICINNAGTVAGMWVQSGVNYHGFVRSAQGTTTSFDPLGSTTTFVTGISEAGTIMGYYWDGATYHGFIRDAQATVMGVDIPGSQATVATAINRDGTVTGYSFGQSSQTAFMRKPDGHLLISPHRKA